MTFLRTLGGRWGLVAVAGAALTAVAAVLLVAGLTGEEEPELPAGAMQASGFALGDEVYATGELRELSADGVTDLLPQMSLLPSAFQGFERRPVLIADQVVPAT